MQNAKMHTRMQRLAIAALLFCLPLCFSSPSALAQQSGPSGRLLRRTRNLRRQPPRVVRPWRRYFRSPLTRTQARTTRLGLLWKSGRLVRQPNKTSAKHVKRTVEPKAKAAKNTTTANRPNPASPNLASRLPLDGLRRFVLSAPPEQLAGREHALLRGAKIGELLAAARTGNLTAEDVATFAQSVHPRLLAVFEKGAGLPGGFFLATTRAVQFPGGNPFGSETMPSKPEQQRYKAAISTRLLQVAGQHRRRGGRGLPHAIQLLTGTSHLVVPRDRRGDAKAVRAAVEAIPVTELQKRHELITGLSSKKILQQQPSRKALLKRGRKKGLVNFDHLLGALGKTNKGRLLIEIYAENMPQTQRVARYLPVTALGEGSYCVDDIARTTVALLAAGGANKNPELATKAKAGLRFVEMMQAKDGEFYNFATLKKGKLAVNKSGATSKKGIDFWAARAVWALGEGYATFKQADPKLAKGLAQGIERTLPRLEALLAKDYGKYQTVKGMRLPRWLINNGADQTAVMLKGLLAYHRALAPGKARDRVARLITKYADGLAQAQIKDPKAADYGRHIHSMGAPESRHLWGSRQVEVLAEAGQMLKRPDYLKSAKLAADHYFAKGTPESLLSAGEEGIAYGIEPIVSGFAKLYQATGDRRYAQQTYRWASWLLGNNKAKALIYDPLSGRGYDGIRPLSTNGKTRHSVNVNAGAESTVEAILAVQAASTVPGVGARLWRQALRVMPK